MVDSTVNLYGSTLSEGFFSNCYPCGPQWYAVSGFLWCVFFVTWGIILCWWIDTRFPLVAARGDARSAAGSRAV